MSATLLLHNGSRTEQEANTKKIIADLKSHQSFLQSTSLTDLLTFFDSLSSHLQKHPIRKKYGAYLNQLLDFMKKDSLHQTLTLALRGHAKALDTFVDLDKNANALFSAQPRGLAVHWLAGNVSILGMFSLIQCLATKNVNLIKASTKSYEDLLDLLEIISEVSTPHISGKDILKCISVIIASHDDEAQKEISQAADIRIAWGGKEAVQSILSLPKQWWTEDIVYGPKYSYAVVDSESLSDDLAAKLAVDMSVFDQYACSSPHTVFIQAPLEEIKNFGSHLAEQLKKVSRLLIPKQPEDEATAMAIHSKRSEYEFIGEVISSEDTTWTIIISEEEGLADPCFSRVIFLRPIKDLSTIATFNDRRKQTLGLAMSEKNRYEFAKQASIHGIDRFPPLGHMTYFESPWDGMFGIDRMVRWVSCYK